MFRSPSGFRWRGSDEGSEVSMRGGWVEGWTADRCGVHKSAVSELLVTELSLLYMDGHKDGELMVGVHSGLRRVV